MENKKDQPAANGGDNPQDVKTKQNEQYKSYV